MKRCLKKGMAVYVVIIPSQLNITLAIYAFPETIEAIEAIEEVQRQKNGYKPETKEAAEEAKRQKKRIEDKVIGLYISVLLRE